MSMEAEDPTQHPMKCPLPFACYVIRGGDKDYNINKEGVFKNTTQRIVCRHLSVYWPVRQLFFSKIHFSPDSYYGIHDEIQLAEVIQPWCDVLYHNVTLH